MMKQDKDLVNDKNAQSSEYFVNSVTRTSSKKEEQLLVSTLNSILHPESQETFDNLLNGIACHYERLGRGYPSPHASDKCTLEYTYMQLRRLFKTELIQALKELKEEAIYGHLAVPDCTDFVPISVIDQKIKALEGEK